MSRHHRMRTRPFPRTVQSAPKQQTGQTTQEETVPLPSREPEVVTDRSGQIAPIKWHIRTARYIAKTLHESSLDVVSDVIVKVVSLISISYVCRLIEEYFDHLHRIVGGH